MAVLIFASKGSHHHYLIGSLFFSFGRPEVLTMSNVKAGPAEKQASSNVRATSDRGDGALHVEDESISSPPDGGYGWAVVVAILFLNAVTWGMVIRFPRRTSTDLR